MTDYIFLSSNKTTYSGFSQKTFDSLQKFYSFTNNPVLIVVSFGNNRTFPVWDVIVGFKRVNLVMAISRIVEGRTIYFASTKNAENRPLLLDE